MKKIIRYIIFYIFFCSLQFILWQYTNVYNISPNFILIAIVYIGIIKGKMPGQLTGFLFGLFWDTFSLIDTFGLRILIFTVIGYFSSELSKNFNGNKIFTQLTIIFFLNIFYSLYFYFICYNTNKTLYFLIQKSIEIFTTMLICPLFFYILKFYI